MGPHSILADPNPAIFLNAHPEPHTADFSMLIRQLQYFVKTHLFNLKINADPVLRSRHFFRRLWLRMANAPEPTRAPAPTYLDRLRLQAKKAAPGGSGSATLCGSIFTALLLLNRTDPTIQSIIPTSVSSGLALTQISTRALSQEQFSIK